jgi:hypothetical protein
MVTELNKQVEPNRNFFKIVFIYLLSESNNEEGKIKNTITRGFELQDYKIDGTELYGFWADLLSKEGLIVEVNYRVVQSYVIGVLKHLNVRRFFSVHFESVIPASLAGVFLRTTPISSLYFNPPCPLQKLKCVQ